MFKEMTLGQYYDADSAVHRLDPRVKLAGTLLFVVSLFFPRSLPGFLLANFFLFLAIGLSKVPPKLLIRGVKPLMVIILLSALIHLFGTAGHEVFSIGPLGITAEGILLAAYLIWRLTCLVVGSSLMTFTTTPGNLADGLEKGLGFLAKIHIPIHDFAMMITIALRFIPILTEELNRIMRAQTARGIDFESGGIIERAKKLVPVLVPLLVSAIRRASDLALAMDARCYQGGEKRTRLYPLRYRKQDAAAYGVLAGYLLLMIWFSFL